MKFVDLFAGLGGFHVALQALGHECVFASEIDSELRKLYLKNFEGRPPIIHGDIRGCADRVPNHDVLCAGFPCQPFSKSGSQLGRDDVTRGTLFDEIIKVLKKREPKYLILENVGNFERHDGGNTWRVVQESLIALGYDVRGTTHVATGGHGLISPHHLGFPHTRERFFIVGSRDKLPDDPFPKADRRRITDLGDLVQNQKDLSKKDLEETRLSEERINCIEQWNLMVQAIPLEVPLPSFPIWSDEFGALYPFKDTSPFSAPLDVLRSTVSPNGHGPTPTRKQLLSRLPSYARTEEETFPRWKVNFISQNRSWYPNVRGYMPPGWLRKIRSFPPSLRKLEWNCNGEPRDLWRCVLQFRPSGLRAKRYTSSPALVAMTVTQIPILGPKKRFLTRTEGMRLQGFPDDFALPSARERAFAALGNAVHTGVVQEIASRLLGGRG